MKNKLFIGIFLLMSVFLVACSTTEKVNVSDNMDLAEFSELKGSYALDSTKSVINWYSERIVGSNHKGNIALKQGFFNADSGSGEFVIDMTSMIEDKGSQALLNHLKNEDFFDVESFPESMIIIKSITLVEDNIYMVVGDLTIKDITNEISFEAMFYNEQDFLVSEAEFSIDRTKWNITYDSGSFFQQIGDRAIRDNIDFTLKLYFK